MTLKAPKPQDSGLPAVRQSQITDGRAFVMPAVGGPRVHPNRPRRRPSSEVVSRWLVQANRSMIAFFIQPSLPEQIDNENDDDDEDDKIHVTLMTSAVVLSRPAVSNEAWTKCCARLWPACGVWGERRTSKIWWL